MRIFDAINASLYSSAGTEMGADEAFVGADGHDGFYRLEIVTSTGERIVSEVVTLKDVDQRFPTYEWWPIRENGEYGPEVEAVYGDD